MGRVVIWTRGQTCARIISLEAGPPSACPCRFVTTTESAMARISVTCLEVASGVYSAKLQPASFRHPLPGQTCAVEAPTPPNSLHSKIYQTILFI